MRRAAVVTAKGGRIGILPRIRRFSGIIPAFWPARHECGTRELEPPSKFGTPDAAFRC
jgi:hypothetical protein